MLKLFGTDGIRAIANEYPLTIDICKKLVHALVLHFNLKSGDTVIIGRDTRESGGSFEKVLTDEFVSLGVNVSLTGVVATPIVSFLVTENKAQLGVMISASHNPYNYNGIKIFKSDGLKLSDEEEQQIENMIFANKLVAASQSVGTVNSISNDLDKYFRKIQREIFPVGNGMKVVVDTANGSFSNFGQLGVFSFCVNVIAIGKYPNGRNINDDCGVMHPDQLTECVKNDHADIGIAFDGDGDRVILCDENGDIMDGDQILALLATYEHCDTVVSTIMANYGLEKYLNNKGISLVRTNVGDRYISEYMRQHSNARFGAEPSGHVIIRDHLLTGDGLYTAIKILALFFKSGCAKFSEFCHVFEPVPSVTKNVKVSDKGIIEKDEINGKINQYKEQLLGRGRLIVRPSGTEPVIRITAEGEDLDELNSIISDIALVLEKI